MSHSFRHLLAVCLLMFSTACFAQTADNSLTIYNQNFAVVRQPLPLNLTAGDNHVTVTDVTAQLEPDSVVLRDPSGARSLQIFEQNYLANPINQGRLLEQSVGKTIDFTKTSPTGGDTVIQGKVIRSGYVPPTNNNPYDGQYGYNSYGYNQQQNQSQSPIIEVDGKLQFGLPGQPLFDSLSADTILKPTLDWTLTSDRPGPVNAELSYITGGLTWGASYNLVAPEGGGPLELTGWVTMTNTCGRDFDDAKIKLMAGDISKINPNGGYSANGMTTMDMPEHAYNANPPVTEKSFDDYHLYTLDRQTTLLNGETKQVEFVRSAAVTSTTTYTYDGYKVNPQYGNNYDYYRTQRDFGSTSNTKVWIGREFKNSKENGLGIALPKGKTRFYQRDSDGQLEFLGENDIDHTPKDETVKLVTGNAFDLIGERTQTDYEYKQGQPGSNIIDESFAIVLRNHKTTPADIRVVEHLYRGSNWTITEKSDEYLKTDAQTMEFMATVPPDGEKTITYTVHYAW